MITTQALLPQCVLIAVCGTTGIAAFPPVVFNVPCTVELHEYKIERYRMTQRLYKILSCEEWQEVLDSQGLVGFGIDLTDGFIHLSSSDQVKETAKRYFSGRDDLMLVSIDGGSLGASLRWEESRGGALFPHVYGVIPMTAVFGAERLRQGPGGEHEFPF